MRKLITLAVVGLAFFAVQPRAKADNEMWEFLTFQDRAWTWRASVPGGWLVKVEKEDKISISYFPDGSHAWNPVKNSPLDYIAARFLKLTENKKCPGVCQKPPNVTRYVSVGDIAVIEPIDPPPADGLTSTSITLRNGKEIKVSESVQYILGAIHD